MTDLPEIDPSNSTSEPDPSPFR